jgi:hypothetical protein
MWLISTLYEVMWLAHGWNQTYKEPTDTNSWHTALAMVATARILILLIISGLFMATYQKGNHDRSIQDEGERQCLLGDESQRIGATHRANEGVNDKATPTKRSGDAQTTTWIDYLIGFKALFPFLW